MTVINSTTRAQRKLLRIPEALEYLGGCIAEKTLRDWIWRRRLPAVRLGRVICVDQFELDRIIEAGTIPAAPEAGSLTPRPRKSPRMRRVTTEVQRNA